MKESVRLERIEVKRLFDRFTYNIDLNNGNNVAILIAPNGLGKTTLFTMIDCIFDPTIKKLVNLCKIPFEECICTLSSGAKVGLKRDDNKKNKRKKTSGVRKTVMHSSSEMLSGYSWVKLIADNGAGEKSFAVSDVITEFTDRFGMDPDSVNELMAILSGDIYDDPRSYSPRFRRALSLIEEGNPLQEYKDWLNSNNSCLNVNFITADRLHNKIEEDWSLTPIERRRERLERGEETPLSIIKKEVSRRLRTTDAEYKRLVSEARDKLPKMYLRSKKNPEITFDGFEVLWKKYISDMEKYHSIGLIDSVQDILETSELEKAYDQYGVFLSTYLKVFEGTLKPWEREYERLKLFVDIINKRNRVTHKILSYGPEGLIVKVDDKEIPLECLSSGEKNDLVMFYNLIFKSKENSLVLIDEPEISLHIEWQEEYLDRLLEICNMNDLQAFVATHSPNIVNGHFELYAKRDLRDESRGN